MTNPLLYYKDLLLHFRLSKLNTEPYKHLKLLYWWVGYGILFAFVERSPLPRNWHFVESPLDAYIPFLEIFIIPYMFWFVYLIGMIVYTLLFEVPAFKKMMAFIIITYTLTILIYLIYPTAQNLRPEVFPRDNALTRFIADFYVFDTNTNVNPSIHVLGSMAAMFAAWDSERFGKKGWRIAFAVACLLICISTVFVKQHSIIDVLTALLLGIVAYNVVYRAPRPKKKARK